MLPADDPDIVNSVRVVDRQLSYDTARGRFWHRASFDGYGETPTGGPWILGAPADSFLTRGRGWPLLGGERGEYELAAGQPSAARARLATMARTANAGYLLPEQVWDNEPPAGQPGFTPGTPTLLGHPAGLDARPVHPAGPRPGRRPGGRAARRGGQPLRATGLSRSAD